MLFYRIKYLLAIEKIRIFSLFLIQNRNTCLEEAAYWIVKKCCVPIIYAISTSPGPAPDRAHLAVQVGVHGVVRPQAELLRPAAGVQAVVQVPGVHVALHVPSQDPVAV